MSSFARWFQLISIIFISISDCNHSLTVSSNTTIDTIIYGGSEGHYNNSWSQFQVNEITVTLSKTTYYYEGAIANLHWIHSDSTFSLISGSYTYTEETASCHISLEPNEYINAYRVFTGALSSIYTDVYIYGIHWRSNLDQEYHCGDEALDQSGKSLYNSMDSGWIFYDRYYLAGFEWKSGEVLDAIGFCFVDIAFMNTSIPKATYCKFVGPPTMQPTDVPTEYPTVSTVNPSNNPSSAPTNNPSFLPTVNPTFNPTFEPTNSTPIAPSIHPSVTPSAFASNTIKTAEYPTLPYASTAEPTIDVLSNTDDVLTINMYALIISLLVVLICFIIFAVLSYLGKCRIYISSHPQNEPKIEVISAEILRIPHIEENIKIDEDAVRDHDDIDEIVIANGEANDRRSTVDDLSVRSWLETIVHLPIYYENFVNNGYTILDDIKEINDSDLKTIGIFVAQHRMQILKRIEALRLRENELVMVSVTNQSLHNLNEENTGYEKGEESMEKYMENKKGEGSYCINNDNLEINNNSGDKTCDGDTIYDGYNIQDDEFVVESDDDTKKQTNN